MRRLIIAVLLLAAICWHSGAWAGDAQVTASSTAASLFMGFAPEKLQDNDPTTAWAEGGEGVGAGEWVEFSFGGKAALRRLVLRNGIGDPTWFSKYNRVKTLELAFSDGTRRRVELLDTPDEQAVDLGGVVSEWLRLIIVDVYKTSPFFNPKTTCLSEARVEFDGAPAAAAAEGPAAAALAQAMQGSPAAAAKTPAAKAQAAPLPEAKPVAAPPAPGKDKPSKDKAGAALLGDYKAGADAVGVIREFYRRLTTLDDTFPEVFARQTRDQEAFVFEVFREYQRKRKTFEKFRNALVDIQNLNMRFTTIDPDRVRVEVTGTYTIYVADTYEDVPENTVFVLLREDGEWRILERRDGAAEERKDKK